LAGCINDALNVKQFLIGKSIHTASADS
jgi:hypothetical protein